MAVVKHPASVMSQSCTPKHCQNVEIDLKMLTNLVDQLNESLAQASALGREVKNGINEMWDNILQNNKLLLDARETMMTDLDSMYKFLLHSKCILYAISTVAPY